MNDTDDSASDEEQLKTETMDYRTLLAMTRPLIITWRTSLSSGGPIFEDKAATCPLEESKARRGQQQHLPCLKGVRIYELEFIWVCRELVYYGDIDLQTILRLHQNEHWSPRLLVCGFRDFS
jgi:hypothetical protein